MSLTTLWIVWGVIGIIGGYMGARLLQPDRNMAVPLICSIAGALLGGWAYVAIFGMTEQNGYLSLITSMILCALCLWIYCSAADRMARRRRDEDASDDDDGMDAEM